MSYHALEKCFREFSFKVCFASTALHCNNAQEILETDIGVVGNAKKWISSFLSCHSQRVLINQNSSKSFDIDCGLPQGSCLGPILFVMYVSRIFNVVENHLPSIHAYAACILMYLSFKPLSTSSQHDALRASQACIADFRAYGIPKYQHDRLQRISNVALYHHRSVP